MVFRKNVAIRFQCSADELSAKLQDDQFLSDAGLKRGKGELLFAANPTLWTRNSFLPQVSIRILSDPDGCSLIAAFSLQKRVKITSILLLCVTILFELIAFAVCFLTKYCLDVLILPLMLALLFSFGAIQFRKYVKDIIGSLMRIQL